MIKILQFSVWPNAQDQQPGQLQRRYVSDSRDAGPVNCIRLFGDGYYPISTPGPLFFIWRFGRTYLPEAGFNVSKPLAPMTLNPPSLLSGLKPS
jgi:hypothetical protein